MKLIKIWLTLTHISFQTFFVSRIGGMLFLAGKLLRFFFFLSFLVILVQKTTALAGYTLSQVILFYLSFNLIDSITQMLFRDVYRFRQQVVYGNFDYILLKPVNPLFRVLFGGADLLDLITLVPFGILLFFISKNIPGINLMTSIFYIALLLNAFIIAAAFHILVLSLAIVSTEIDHAIMMYRDITGMGKLPVHIYEEPLKSLVTFVVPVGIMMTYPVDGLLGKLNAIHIFGAFAVSGILFVLSLTIWDLSLKKYTSASS